MTYDPRKIKDTLPDKMSDLLELALADEAKAHRSKKIRVNMSQFHSPAASYGCRNSVCMMCLAGAVMYFDLGTPLDDVFDPDDFATSIRRKLYALDDIRTGDMESAFRELRQRRKQGAAGIPNKILVASYGMNRARWRRDMHKIKRLLRKSGL